LQYYADCLNKLSGYHRLINLVQLESSGDGIKRLFIDTKILDGLENEGQLQTVNKVESRIIELQNNGLPVYKKLLLIEAYIK